MLRRALLLSLTFIFACDSSGGEDPAADAQPTPTQDAEARLDGAVDTPDAAVIEDAAVDALREDAAPLPTNPECARAPALASPLFEEATEGWGLEGITGTRVSVVDYDGDGLTDLVVRNTAATPDTDDNRLTWLLRNTGSGFEDVTLSSGLTAPIEEGGPRKAMQITSFADVDNDGDLDVFVGVDSRTPFEWQGERVQPQTMILLNDGAGHFAPPGEGEAHFPTVRITAPCAGAFVDYDRDGLVDLWMPQGGDGPRQDDLYRNTGAGGFEEVTEFAGLKTLPWMSSRDMNEGRAHTVGWGGAAWDLNGDGRTELLSTSYGRSPNHLWVGFEDSAGATGFSNRSVSSGFAYDEDQDWSENQFARCYCQEHPDAEDCEGVERPNVQCQAGWSHDSDREPHRLGGNSAATLLGDLDNDGDFDLVTTEIQHWWAGRGSDRAEVLRNDGETFMTFERPGREATGLEVPHAGASWDEGIMSGAILDFDNDGWRDVYLGASDYPGNYGLLYHNLQSPEIQFERLEVGDYFEHNRSHGAAIADFDNDGDLDMVVGHSRARCGSPNDCYETQQVRLFLNQTGGHWIQVKLEGAEGTNRAAIGARVTVRTQDTTQIDLVDGGHGHFGAQSDLRLHFGLGDRCWAEVKVRWPNGELTEEAHVLEADQRYLIKQGEAPVALD